MVGGRGEPQLLLTDHRCLVKGIKTKKIVLVQWVQSNLPSTALAKFHSSE